MPRNLQVLLRGRQQGFIVGKLALREEHVDARGITGGEGLLHELQIVAVLLEKIIERA